MSNDCLSPHFLHQVLSNEPGYYEDGSFGIRIENLMVVVPADTPHSFRGKQCAPRGSPMRVVAGGVYEPSVVQN